MVNLLTKKDVRNQHRLQSVNFSKDESVFHIRIDVPNENKMF